MSILTSTISASCSFHSYTPHFSSPSPSPSPSHYTLIVSDTKYWRGIGRHNHGITGTPTGSRDGNDPSTRRDTLSRENSVSQLDMRVVTHDLQSVLREIGDLTLDFAFLKIKQKLGTGAHAVAYEGSFKNENVAVKVFCPEEVNKEIIKEFLNEAKLSMKMRHKNVVQFKGIVVQPPEIAVVTELCEGGDLKSNLAKNSEKWSKSMRMTACLDCACAVEYLHSEGYIHRDIKTDNFFVALHEGMASSSISSFVQTILNTLLYQMGRIVLVDHVNRSLSLIFSSFSHLFTLLCHSLYRI